MTQTLTCTSCDSTIAVLQNTTAEPAICDIYAYHQIEHLRERLAQEIEAIRIDVAQGLDADPYVIGMEAARMATRMAADIVRGKK